MMISVVIPVYNEEESLEELFKKLEESAQQMKVDSEYIFVDDGSTDNSLEVLRSLHSRSPKVKVISFRRNYGKSAALSVGFREARGDVVFTIDADLQDDPMEFVNLLEKIESGVDLVSGWKQNRQDPWTKTIPSKLFNFVTSRLSGIRIHDFNCGLKAYRKEVVDALSIYGELHRFIPVLAGWEGFTVDEVPVQHFKRKHGRSKYGSKRLLNGLFDLITVMFITRRALSPLHFFGRISFLLFVIGLIPQVYFFIQWLGGTGLRVRPIMLLGFVFIIVALQIASIGLLAEMISSGSAKAATYSLRERLTGDSSTPSSEKEKKSAP
ncbi:MAG: glycosyltransferase [Candidatus Latescibacteria bacterium]|nr:glycosyltransferase [Candidatus Latescibacterota bacterium]NIM21095.1 glycosyltransferase [Candidatus Latescibacterota bacterium]NIM65230.1 glycosyltransferase [Candidatus Latescibacterota bacterium]NIO01745.1 glycosyltransferase [Candidatus Latescibacterota bacterium]NIO28262.1 glycosyltransferase [Candidatus Latescibacterota bacterium]